MPSPTPRAEIEHQFIRELDRKHRIRPRRNTLCWSCYLPYPCPTRLALDALAAQVANAEPDPEV